MVLYRWFSHGDWKSVQTVEFESCIFSNVPMSLLANKLSRMVESVIAYYPLCRWLLKNPTMLI